VADPEQLARLKQQGGEKYEAVEAWNRWRKENPFLAVDLRQADLSAAFLSRVDLNEADLRGADLSHATLNDADLHNADGSESNLFGARLSNAHLSQINLREANLSRARLDGANLPGADLRRAFLPEANLQRALLNGADLRGAICDRADLRGADLREAKLANADLRRADLRGANLSAADLSGANLSKANLSGAILVGGDLSRTCLAEARVYGVSAWDVNLQDAIQTSLIITPPDEPEITVDSLEVAQFIYLLLNNARIRDVINTITSKVVLILGRFTADRKKTLDAIRDALRDRNYLPIVFDFEKPNNRDYTETVFTLASLARFVIADLTDARSVQQELEAVVPRLFSVPVRPVLLEGQTEWAMFRDLARHRHVIQPTFYYTDDLMLLQHLENDIIEPAEQRAREVAGK
jgi:uncharacterized protein YjbI with pentapeptide repeats